MKKASDMFETERSCTLEVTAIAEKPHEMVVCKEESWGFPISELCFILEEKIHQSMAAVDDKRDRGHQRLEQWISKLTPVSSNVENYYVDQVYYIHEKEPMWFTRLLLEVWKKSAKNEENIIKSIHPT